LALGAEVKLLMKGATTNQDDEYLTTSIPVALAFGLKQLDEEVFVEQLKVQTDGKVHHIIVKGCSDIIQKIQELDITDHCPFPLISGICPRKRFIIE
jgi:hypothetical protein